MNRLHRGLLKVSGGRFGWTAANMPVLELTTVGRKSGKPRSVMLTSPHRDGDVIVIVASKGGEDTHPAWFLNLRENPQVVVTTRDTHERQMVAQVASPRALPSSTEHPQPRPKGARTRPSRAVSTAAS